MSLSTATQWARILRFDKYRFAVVICWFYPSLHLDRWLLNFAIAYSTPYLVNAIGPKVFFVWAGCCLLCTIFAYFCIPETKGELNRSQLSHDWRLSWFSLRWTGLSLEQVDLLYKYGGPRQSPRIRKQIFEGNIHEDIVDGAVKTRSDHVENLEKTDVMYKETA